jgi:hypothetical protein
MDNRGRETTYRDNLLVYDMISRVEIQAQEVLLRFVAYIPYEWKRFFWAADYRVNCDPFLQSTFGEFKRREDNACSLWR